MGILRRIFKPKVQDTSENHRLKVALHERPLREHFMSPEALEIVLEQRKQWTRFHEPPQIRRIDKPIQR